MKIKKSGIVIISLFFLGSIVLGVFLGWSISETRNIINSEYITDFDTALPTKLLDINGEVITEGEHKIKFSIGDYEIVRSITAIKGKTYTANFSLDLDISEN